MDVEFILVNKQNKHQILKLDVKPEQRNMIETVTECLSEADTLSLWRPVGIACDGELVGFAMYGKWVNDDKSYRVWCDRFFIDKHFQGKGIAKEVFPKLLKHIKDEYACESIYLSVYGDNDAAIHLYKEFGFEFNDEIDTKGEKVMCCKL